MANCLRMDLAHTILSLHNLRWPDRRIARELGIHRETVAQHIRLAAEGPKPANQAPTGSEALAKPANQAPTGSVESKPATQAPTGFLEGVERGVGVEPADQSDVQPPMDGGFIALLPTAAGDSLSNAAAEDRALSGSNPSAAQGPIRQMSQLGNYRAGSLHCARLPAGPKAKNAGGFGELAPQVLPTRNSEEPLFAANQRMGRIIRYWVPKDRLVEVACLTCGDRNNPTERPASAPQS